jgi:hypothetical protein
VDSKQAVAALLEVDPGFTQLCKTLFGDVVDPGEVWSFLYTPSGVSKMGPGVSDLHVPSTVKAAKGILVPKQMNSITNAPAATVVPPVPGAKKPAPTTIPLSKELDIIWSGEFSKTNVDKRQAFGWASVVEIDGQPIIDLQGDYITPDDIEKAAYTYVRESRVGGDQHAQNYSGIPLQAGDMIESFVSTPDKIAKMGLPSDFPVGWWVGYQITQDSTWDDIKSGRKTGFSVHGKGKRVPLDVMV